MIPVSDLRKGNLVRTEHGILPVKHISFGDVYVMGKGGRTLHAKQVEGVNPTDKIFIDFGFDHIIKNECNYWSMVGYTEIRFFLDEGKIHCSMGDDDFGFLYKIIFSVHKLQNLFFELTDTELKKPNE